MSTLFCAFLATVLVHGSAFVIFQIVSNRKARTLSKQEITFRLGELRTLVEALNEHTLPKAEDWIAYGTSLEDIALQLNHLSAHLKKYSKNTSACRRCRKARTDTQKNSSKHSCR